jgi:hypothetical protein
MKFRAAPTAKNQPTMKTILFTFVSLLDTRLHAEGEHTVRVEVLAQTVAVKNVCARRETKLHQTGSTLTPLDFKDFIPAAENPLGKASDGKPVGLAPGMVTK